jgi:hypothetical protein
MIDRASRAVADTFFNDKCKFYKICIFQKVKGKGKGKAIPLQASTGPEGSRSLRLPHFKTVGT